eukprot:430376-Amphidinium_carterae.1
MQQLCTKTTTIIMLQPADTTAEIEALDSVQSVANSESALPKQSTGSTNTVHWLFVLDCPWLVSLAQQLRATSAISCAQHSDAGSTCQPYKRNCDATFTTFLQ